MGVLEVRDVHAGYNGTQMADELGWSQGRVSRLLAGKRGGSGIDVSAFHERGAQHRNELVVGLPGQRIGEPPIQFRIVGGQQRLHVKYQLIVQRRFLNMVPKFGIHHGSRRCGSTPL